MKILNGLATPLALVLVSMSVLGSSEIVLATQPTNVSEDIHDEFSLDDQSGLKSGSERLTDSTTRTSVELSGGEFGTGFRDYDGTVYTGKGQVVVVIDGAFNPNHSAFQGKVIHEACFGTRDKGVRYSENLCSPKSKKYRDDPEVIFETGAGTSKYDPKCLQAAEDDKERHVCHDTHGTLTAGVAAGNIRQNAPKSQGIASGAQLVLLKVGRAEKRKLSRTGMYSALDYASRDLVRMYGKRISSVVISAHIEPPAIDGSSCEYDQRLSEPAAALEKNGSAIVVASGNDGSSDRTGALACREGTVAVGASKATDLNDLTSYSNASRRVNLLAPVDEHFEDVDRKAENTKVLAAPCSLVTEFSAVWENVNCSGAWGTSFAAPQVAGAYAVLRQKWPNKSVDELTALLQDSGVRVKDARPRSTGIVTPRMVLGEAIRDRDTRADFDFTGDSAPDFPVLSANGKTLAFGRIAENGRFKSGFDYLSTTAGDWSGKKFVAPVRDFLRNGTNGFITDQGSSFQYYEFDSNSGSLKAPVSIFSGLNASTERLAGVNGLKLPGTGKGVLVQGESGPIKLRMLFPETTQLGNAITVHDQDGLELVGSADLNQDGEPDLVMREKATGFPVAKMGTGNSETPFAESITYLSKAGFWPNIHHLFVMDDYAGGKPQLGYQVKASRKMVMFPLNSDGTLAPSSEAYTAASWAEGVRILMANDY